MGAKEEKMKCQYLIIKIQPFYDQGHKEISITTITDKGKYSLREVLSDEDDFESRFDLFMKIATREIKEKIKSI